MAWGGCMKAKKRKGKVRRDYEVYTDTLKPVHVEDEILSRLDALQASVDRIASASLIVNHAELDAIVARATADQSPRKPWWKRLLRHA